MVKSLKNIGYIENTQKKYSFVDIQSDLSLSRTVCAGEWDGFRSLRFSFGGDEVRFRVEETESARIGYVTEEYVWLHVFLDGERVQVLKPDSGKGSLLIPINIENGTEVRILRTSVSSGPFYTDAHLIDISVDVNGQIVLPGDSVPEEVFCTFGDSISGNSLIGGEQPFDPYNVVYGWAVCDNFGWQYLNTARDGSGLCSRMFENPLASERVAREVIAHRPDYLFMLYGTNDLACEISPDEFGNAYEELLKTLKKGLRDSGIACSALLWRNDQPEDKIKEYSNVIKSICSARNIPCCDPYEVLKDEDFTDGLHPNAQGHKKLGKYFTDFIKNSFPELKRRL